MRVRIHYQTVPIYRIGDPSDRRYYRAYTVAVFSHRLRQWVKRAVETKEEAVRLCARMGIVREDAYSALCTAYNWHRDSYLRAAPQPPRVPANVKDAIHTRRAEAARALAEDRRQRGLDRERATIARICADLGIPCYTDQRSITAP